MSDPVYVVKPLTELPDFSIDSVEVSYDYPVGSGQSLSTSTGVDGGYLVFEVTLPAEGYESGGFIVEVSFSAPSDYMEFYIADAEYVFSGGPVTLSPPSSQSSLAGMSLSYIHTSPDNDQVGFARVSAQLPQLPDGTAGDPFWADPGNGAWYPDMYLGDAEGVSALRLDYRPSRRFNQGGPLTITLRTRIDVGYEELPEPEPEPEPLPPCFWTDLVNLQQHCTPAPKPPVEVETPFVKVFTDGTVDRDFVVSIPSDADLNKPTPSGGFYAYSYTANAFFELSATGAVINEWPLGEYSLGGGYSNSLYRTEPDLRAVVTRYDSSLPGYVYQLFSSQTGYTAFPPIDMVTATGSTKQIHYIDDAGRFYIGAHGGNNAPGTFRPTQWHVDRYLPDGSLDPAFSRISTPVISSGGLTMYRCYVFGGYVYMFYATASGQKTLLPLRFALDGTPDPSFSPPLIYNSGSGLIAPTVGFISSDVLALNGPTQVSSVNYRPYLFLDPDFSPVGEYWIEEPYDWDVSSAPNLFWPTGHGVTHSTPLRFFAVAPPFGASSSELPDRLFGPALTPALLNDMEPALFDFEFLPPPFAPRAGVVFASEEFVILGGNLLGYTIPGE